jgi:hypothetical protein
VAAEKRERCIYCLRELATEGDWEANSQLPSGRAEDEEAERLGLNALCWEPFQDSCIARVIEIGGPLDIQQAVKEIRRTEAERDQAQKERDAAKNQIAEAIYWLKGGDEEAAVSALLGRAAIAEQAEGGE